MSGHDHGAERALDEAADALAEQELVREHQEHHAGRSLNALAASATNHCLTGCVLGEVVGMVIATALGWGNSATIALSVALAFLFGYTLTSLPLFRAGLPFRAIVPIALAADTVSIAIMELIDNGFILLVPGALEAGLRDLKFWLPLLGGFVIAWPFAFAVNRALIRRGKGHAVVHEYHH
jgi:Domain of unknown function (DUF4396)